MAPNVHKRSLVIGLLASLCVHLIAWWAIHLAAPETTPEPEPAAVTMDFDIHEAPTPPEAEMPVDMPDPVPQDGDADGDADADADADADGDADADADAEEDQRVPVPLEPIEDETEDDEALASAMLDAGVPDASEVVVTIEGQDAGPAGQDGGADMVASAHLDTSGLDSLMDSSALGPVASTEPEAASATGTTGTAGTSASGGAALTDGLVTADGEEGYKGPHSPSQANLLAYFPEGEVISVLVRFDRLRDTEWAEKAEAVLAPMPDYRSLIGGRDVAISQLFHSLVISSPSPRDVTATTLVGHTALATERLRTFLDHPGARVTWRPARGGTLGTRARSRLIAPHDKRVFLLPASDWVVLTQPAKLGAAVEPAPQAQVPNPAVPAALPGWLSTIQQIEREAGQDQGPAVVVTVARLLPEVWKLPYADEKLPTPDKLTLALEVTDKGFFVRGTMVFADAAQATGFVTTMERVQRDFVATKVGEIVLSRVQAYNAIRGLTLARNRSMVGFATSISVADARAAMAFAADQTRAFFLSGGAEPEPEPEPAKRL